MDISGYRGHGRAGHLIQSTWAYADDPSGKNKRKAGGLSLGTKAFFALLLLLAAWGGIRRALPGPEQAAEAKPQAQAADAAKAGSAAGGAAGQAAVRQAAAGGTVGQAAAGGGKAPVTRGQGIRSVLTPEAAAKLDAQYEARIERQMRIIPRCGVAAATAPRAAALPPCCAPLIASLLCSDAQLPRPGQGRHIPSLCRRLPPAAGHTHTAGLVSIRHT